MKYIHLFIIVISSSFIYGQMDYDAIIDKNFKSTLLLHKELVSIPNLPADPEVMIKNIHWVAERYDEMGFTTTLLESSTLPILLAERVYNPSFKTVLFYFHIDGQPVNPKAWNQSDPFVPVLKEQNQAGIWEEIGWDRLDGTIDDEWRIFARAAADDKAPIIMLLTALQVLRDQNKQPHYNVKVIFDPEEEYASEALLSTLDQYKERYASDYFIVMDGPAHASNRPTVTYGCRGIATCSITTYGAALPQHSGHYGNYVPNPVFSIAHLLSSMKDDYGRVLIEDYYNGIEIKEEDLSLLESVPFEAHELNHQLGIHSAENVGRNYQEALQYPSLNVRQIGTSWKGKGLKTVIPEYATADLDVRLVPETDGAAQLLKIKKHIQSQGYYITDKDPTEDERHSHSRIVKFVGSPGINAFRTSPNSDFGRALRAQLTESFGTDPVVIRMMGGTVPIVPLINTLGVPTTIVPMVNMDNNQHSPNENIRIGNIRQGIKICLSLLEADF